MNRGAGPEWFDAAFGEDYLRVYAHRDDAAAAAEAGFAVERLELAAGARILDCACGAGRHVRAFRRMGFDATGIDRSRALLAAASAGGSGPRLVRGDLRALPFAPAAFDGATSFFTSFGYFETEAEDLLVLRGIRRTLRPAGRFFLDFLDPAHAARTLVPRSRREAEGIEVLEERSIECGRVRKRVTLRRPGGPDRCYEESVRLYEASDLESLLRAAGFVVRSVHGGFDGRPAGAGTRLLVSAEASR